MKIWHALVSHSSSFYPLVLWISQMNVRLEVILKFHDNQSRGNKVVLWKCWLNSFREIPVSELNKFINVKAHYEYEYILGNVT